MKSEHFSVTLYTKAPTDPIAKLRTMQIFAKSHDEAQEKVLTQCEASGVIHGNIVAVTKHPLRG